MTGAGTPNAHPCIRDTGITVASILDRLAAGETQGYILAQQPTLSIDDIAAALAFAKARLSEPVPDETGAILYRAMFENNAAVKLLLTPDTCTVVDANPVACHFYGYSLEEFKQKTIADIDTVPEAEITDRVARLKETERAIFISQHRLASGSLRDVEIHASSLNLQGRRLIFCIIHDITERTTIEREREHLITELNAFAHTVAHDLKNPLSITTTLVETLYKRFEEMETERVGEYLKMIHDSNRRMSSIVDELLLLAGLQIMDEVTIKALDMADIVAGALQRLSLYIVESKAIISEPAVWPIAQGHAPWVESIWANYINNAIRYGGDPPLVEVGATVLGNNTIRFWVSDNGPGIAPEDIDLLFSAHIRLEMAREQHGYGLGLSIVRRIVEKLGGEVGVKSVLGEGSTFSFTLPMAEHIPDK
jgi:PAS domain S-box-containing protein